jgi:hypothetical protein
MVSMKRILLFCLMTYSRFLFSKDRIGGGCARPNYFSINANVSMAYPWIIKTIIENI